MTLTNDFCIYYDKEIFSPYYKCDIVFPSLELPLIKCTSVLQAFETCKLLYFENYDKLFFATSTKNPINQIQIGHKILNYDRNKWSSAKYDIMYQIELQKYLQNENLRTELLSEKYDNIEFVYANPLDNWWGTGLGEYTDMIKNKTEWRGKNMHGEILKNVRKNIIEYYK